jgi:hypothetical protein
MPRQFVLRKELVDEKELSEDMATNPSGENDLRPSRRFIKA